MCSHSASVETWPIYHSHIQILTESFSLESKLHRNLIKQQIQLFCCSVCVAYSFFLSYKFRQDNQFVQHTHTHSLSKLLWAWIDIIFSIRRPQCLEMYVINIRRQHGTATKVSATHKWCTSIQVSCWDIHMWMWENYKANSLIQNESAVVQISLPVTQSNV